MAIYGFRVKFGQALEKSMQPRLAPPRAVLEQVAALSSLRLEVLSELVEVLESKIQYPFDTDDILAQIPPSIEIESEQLKGLLKLLEELFEVAAEVERQYGLTTQEFSATLFNLIERGDIAKLENANELQDLLIRLLNCKHSIGFPPRIKDVKHANERNFIDSRIITDVRPVFEYGVVAKRPAAAVIVHNLKIEYREDVSNLDFFVALDKNDLLTLKRTIDRALEKENILEQTFVQNNSPN